MADLGMTVAAVGPAAPPRGHVCAFFRSREEERRALLPLMRDRAEQGDRLLCLIDARRRAERMGWLEQAGIDARAAERSGRVEIRGWHETYLRGGAFDRPGMLDFVDQILADGPSQGFRRTLVWANMEWAVEEPASLAELVEYETCANEVVARHDALVVCAYDLKRFDAALVLDVLRAHPLVVLDGAFRPNSLYAQPESGAEWGGLTRRERVVAALVARGLTNPAIAAELGLAVGTVRNHLHHVLAKLGFARRAELAAWIVGDPVRQLSAVSDRRSTPRPTPGPGRSG